MDTLLPPNATDLERSVEGAMGSLSAIPVPLATLWSPSTCPAALLPWLAWALSVDVWDSAWPEATKRRVIAASYGVHRKKGTVGAVKAALATFDLPVALTEWWQVEPPAVPHTFGLRATITGRGATGLDLSALARSVAAVKPVRSHLTWLSLADQHQGAVPHIAARAQARLRIALYPAPTRSGRTAFAPHIGAALHLQTRISLTSRGPLHA